MSDEDIIKRKLLIDGDGTGDDRRLNVIAKLMRKWVSSDESPSESQLVHDKLLAQLSLCEYSVKRSQILSKTIKKQLENYKEMQNQVEKQIIEVKESIEQNKENLVQAKVWKQNHMMYDLLAQSINEQPARKETNENLLTLKAQIAALRSEKEFLENKMDMRRKQFYVFVSSASRLQAMHDEGDEENEGIELMTVDSVEPEPMSE